MIIKKRYFIIALLAASVPFTVFASDSAGSKDIFPAETNEFVTTVEGLAENTDVNRGGTNWQFQTGVAAAFRIYLPAQWTSSHIYPGEKPGYGGAIGWAVRFSYADRWYIRSGLNFEFDSALIQIRPSRPSDTWPSYRYTRGGLALPCVGGYRFALTD